MQRASSSPHIATVHKQPLHRCAIAFCRHLVSRLAVDVLEADVYRYPVRLGKGLSPVAGSAGISLC